MAGKEKKGLGTGLDALFGSAAFDDEEAELLTLPISKVEPRSEQPRKYFDEDALQELADSIAQYGLIQPITVRKQPSGYYQIIAGERRWRASGSLGLPKFRFALSKRTTAERRSLRWSKISSEKTSTPLRKPRATSPLLKITVLLRRKRRRASAGRAPLLQTQCVC